MAWQLKRERYMTREEVRKLRKSAEELALADLEKGRDTWVRAWAVIDFESQTGLRVSELSAVRIGDLELSGKTPCVWVVGGKGHKAKGKKVSDRDPVSLSKGLVKHLREFIDWKKLRSESVKPEAPLFASSRGAPFSVRALQTLFKRACEEAGLPSYYSIHSLRHSWGTYLYEKTKNLRLVQKELRHRNIQTTTVYADVTPEEASEAVNNVWNEED